MSLFKRNNKVMPRRRRAEAGQTVKGDESSAKPHVFQRNRTITGSISNQFSATTSHKPDLESPRKKAHDLAIKRRKIGGVFIIVLLASLLMYWLLTQFSARVSVGVSDSSIFSKSVDNDAYEKVISDYLGNNPLQRFRFALDPQKLLSYVNNEYPEVGSIDKVTMQAVGETRMTISMRQPLASWTINNVKYYVDASGMAFQKNYFSQSVIEIVDESGIAVDSGTPVASNRFLAFVGRVVATVKSYKYTVTQAIIPRDTTRQLEIKLKGESPRIKLSVDRPVGEQVEDMVRSLKYLKTHSRSAQYVDVRVSGKAFYR